MTTDASQDWMGQDSHTAHALHACRSPGLYAMGCDGKLTRALMVHILGSCHVALRVVFCMCSGGGGWFGGDAARYFTCILTVLGVL